jgi:hypothetical protein
VVAEELDEQWPRFLADPVVSPLVGSRASQHDTPARLAQNVMDIDGEDNSDNDGDELTYYDYDDTEHGLR